MIQNRIGITYLTDEPIKRLPLLDIWLLVVVIQKVVDL
jgi:hypothetical protein